MKIVRYVVIIIVTIWLSLNEGFTAFESMDRSAEGVKAGGGGTAKLMGVSSLYYNAAGLAGMEKTELNVQYSRLLLALDNDGLDYFHLIAGYPFGGLGLAVSFNRFSSELYAEQILSIGCGGDLVKGWYKTIAGGVRVKLLKVGYEENDYTRLDRLFITEGYSQNALSFDVGLLGYSKAGFSYGIALKDINSPDISLEGSGHTVPVLFQAGTSYRWIFKKRVYGMDEVLFSLDMKYMHKDYSFHIGIEPWLFDYILSPGIGMGIGNKELSYITAGGSYQLPMEKVSESFATKNYILKFNYAFQFYLNGLSSGTYGDHYISISFKW